MKRFQFPLESVLRVRRLEAEVAEASLLCLERERMICRQQMDCLAAESRKRPTSLSNGELVHKSDFEYMERLTLYVRREGGRLANIEAALLHRIAAAKAQLLQAQQRLELLNKLRETAHNAWRREADKELQTLAEESFNHRMRHFLLD